jgi:hypothetical protein
MSTNTQPARSYWVSAASPALQELRRGLKPFAGEGRQAIGSGRKMSPDIGRILRRQAASAR